MNAGIGGIATDKKLGTMRQRQLPNLIKVKLLGFLVYPIVSHLKPLTGYVNRRTVGQVATVGQVHAHDGVAGLQQREERRQSWPGHQSEAVH